ncbi:MAG: hypothetical protein CMM16_01340 [Rhodospirillaceae bacterium]|nr:hypothetical protein [Rhodospirillaceae bacterium]
MKKFSRFFRSEPLLLVLWANELVRLVWSPLELQEASGWLMIVYVVMSLTRLRRGTFILCAPLVVLAAVLAISFDEWPAVMRGFQNGAVFMAFFGTIVLLRALADQRAEISEARLLFNGIRPEQTNGAFLVGAHLIGSVLVVGVLAVLAPIIKDDADYAARRRAAEVSQRGMCLAPLWSPFWVAAAFAAQQIPGVPAWEIMLLGLGMAGIGLILAHVMFARAVGLVDLWHAVRGFAPIVPLIAVCACMIAGLSSILGMSTLQALIATIPLLSLVMLLATRGGQIRGAKSRALAVDTWRGSSRVCDEIVVVTIALTLGRVLEVAVQEIGVGDMVGALSLPGWGVIACVISGITLASLAGIHQVVSIIVVLVVFMPLQTGISDVVMMEAALIGWAFASMVGVAAVSTATASAMFGVPRVKLIFGPNLLFVCTFGALSVVLLSLVNSLISDV